MLDPGAVASRFTSALAGVIRCSWPVLAALAGALGCASPIEMEDIAYDDRFGEETTLDLYLPEDGATQRPAVLFFHGGVWASGDKSQYGDAAQRLGGSGYVAATANYRLVPEGSYPAAIQDARCALAFLRAHAAEYGIDPDRIAVAGYAAGGYLASMLGVAQGTAELEPDCSAGTTGAANAVIAAAAMHDLTLLDDTSEVEEFLGGTLADLPDRYSIASPVSHVKPGAPPYLLIHGDFDWMINVEQSGRMEAALREAGGSVRLLELFDPGHSLAAGADNGGLYFGSVRDRPESWTVIIDFLYESLGAP